jgi:hypothetical protein
MKTYVCFCAHLERDSLNIYFEWKLFPAKVVQTTETRTLCPVQILLSLEGFETRASEYAGIFTLFVRFLTLDRGVLRLHMQVFSTCEAGFLRHTAVKSCLKRNLIIILFRPGLLEVVTNWKEFSLRMDKIYGKIKLSLCLSKRYAMIYGEVEL